MPCSRSPSAWAVALHVLVHHVALARGEPLRVLRLVGQIEVRDDAGDHGGDALEQQHPLPAGPAVDAVHAVHDGAGQRTADHAREGRGRHEGAEGRGAAVVGEPVGQIQDDAGIEAGLEHAEQEAQRIEHRRRRHVHHRDRGQAPADGDAHDGLARADLLQQQVARHLEEEIAEEEDAGAEAVDRLAPFQVVEHRQLDEADVDAIDPGQHPEQHQEGNEAPEYLAIDAVQLGRGLSDHADLLLTHAGVSPAQSE